jgi:hypothetical protein
VLLVKYWAYSIYDTWTLDNNNTWTSKLTQGNYTVTVNLSGNGGSVTNPSSIASITLLKDNATNIY